MLSKFMGKIFVRDIYELQEGWVGEEMVIFRVGKEMVILSVCTF